jgi:hypothetical protein
LSDIIDMGAVEHLPRLRDPPRLAAAQIDQRIAARSIDAGEAQDVGFGPPRPGRRRPARLVLEPRHPARGAGPRRARLVDPRAAGKPLNRKNRYLIHFDKDGQPKVKAFWSVTMYNLKYNLVANSINRYSLGNRSGMKPDADGGLTIYV